MWQDFYILRKNKNMNVIVTGATGYVGEGVLLECLNNPRVDKVLSVSRKHCGHIHPKLEEYLVRDFMSLKAGDPRLQGYDAVFFCAGMSSVGVKEDVYKGISHDIPLHFAQILEPKDKITFVYVSGAGNYNHTDQMWVRVKKSTEDSLTKMKFKGAYNFRPAIMWRYKGQIHIQKMQYVFWALFPVFKLLGLWNTMSEVGRAMIAVSEKGYPRHEIEVRDISILSEELKA